VLLGLSGTPAKALPFGSLLSAPPDVISVATGCGPGRTRSYRHWHPRGDWITVTADTTIRTITDTTIPSISRPVAFSGCGTIRDLRRP
jgi:hypothetical protein